MPKRKSKKIFQYLFLFLIIGTLNNKNLSTFELPKIDEISVSGLSKKENLEVLKSLEKFKENNLFFLSKFELVKIIEKNDYIEKFYVSKKYPSSLNIHLQKTRLMALINKDAKFFYIGSNRKFIEASEQVKNLPFIYGEFDIDKFFEIKEDIDQSNFKLSQVKNLFFFPSGRWDIETHQGILIKLPIFKVKESLNLYLELLNKDDFKNIKIIDLRQNNQVITNE